MRYLILVGLALGLSACTTLRGDPVDLHAVAQPDPVVAPPHPVVPPVTHGKSWRAWVPRHVAPDGTVTEGHFVEMNPAAPPVELVEPKLTIPRAPKVGFQKPKQKGPPAPAGGLPSPLSHPAMPPAVSPDQGPPGYPPALGR